MASIGPGPFAAMVLSDMGADVIRVDRVTGGTLYDEQGLTAPTRGRRSIALNLKHVSARPIMARLVRDADALVEGNRPGVMEKLGFGPSDCWEWNPRLVFARATGWGQDGPLKNDVGHDLNYLALTGALSLFGPTDGPPTWPLNLLGDYAGGGLFLSIGILAALLETSKSGVGQVVDAAMIDGVSVMLTRLHAVHARGLEGERGRNVADGGSHFYNVYETADGGWMSVAAMEPQFYLALIEGLGLDPVGLPEQYDEASWAAMRLRFIELFAEKSREEWTEIFSERYACVTPVLTLAEAANHPHARARSSFTVANGLPRPEPAPRFSRTPSVIARGLPVR